MKTGRTIVALALALCIAGCGSEDDGAELEWVVEPIGNVEEGNTIEASWTILSNNEVEVTGLVACVEADPDCGLIGSENIYKAVGATLGEDGVYTASMTINEPGRYTITAFCDNGEAFAATPKGVVVSLRSYPKGPFGNVRGDVIENLTFTGFIDSDADEDDSPFNEPQHEISLQDFFVNNDPGAKVLLLNSAAGWCGPCVDETRHLVNIYPSYYAQGARFMSAIFEDQNGQPASIQYVQGWGSSFNSPFPNVADPLLKLGPYYKENTVPMTVYVDLTTMEILQVTQGYNPNSITDALDFYLATIE